MNGRMTDSQVQGSSPLWTDRVDLPGLIRHPGTASVVAHCSEGIILVEQFRSTLGTQSMELPGGIVEQDESPFDAARRELIEETGFVCASLRLLGGCILTPGYSNEVAYLFRAEGEILAAPTDHSATVHMIPEDSIDGLLVEGQILDAKTILGLLWSGALVPRGRAKDTS
jgi:ADP-ribose pyrophosphatase